MIRLVGMGYDTSPDYLSAGDDRSFRAGLRSYMNSTLSNAYLQIHTDEYASEVATIRVFVNWRTIGKNVAGTYGALNDGLWSNFENPSGECNPRTSTKYSGTDWSIELRNIGEYLPGGTVLTPSNTSLGDEIAPNGYSFSNRKYDSVSLFFTVVATYNDASIPESRYVANEFWFTYFPVYTLTGVRIEDGQAIVSYDHGDWNRVDDRFALEGFTQGGRDLAVDDAIPYVTFGPIAAPGRIALPLEAFTRIPDSVSTNVRIRMNANFRSEGDEWGYVSGTSTLVNDGDCNTPTLSKVSMDENSLVVRVGDSGDKSNPIETIYVTLVDYTGSGTTVTTTPGSTATFPYPPLNERLTVQVIGYDADGDASDPVSIDVGTIHMAGGVVPTISAEDGSVSVTLRYNVEMDWTYEPVYQAVKFSGRARETVGYGIGGSVVGNVTCGIIDDSSYGDLYQSRRDFEALAFAGVCIFRDSDGSRKRVTVGSVGESWSIVSKNKKISLQLREVS